MKLGLFVLVSLLAVSSCGDDGSTVTPTVDATPGIDGSGSCMGLDSIGGFDDCSVCDGVGRGCDTLDVQGTTTHVCDCERSSDCPCGLTCGRLQVADGVYVSSICVR